MLAVTAVSDTTGAINSKSPLVCSPGDGNHPPDHCQPDPVPVQSPGFTGMGSGGAEDTAQSDVLVSAALFVPCQHSPCSTPCSGKGILAQSHCLWGCCGQALTSKGSATNLWDRGATGAQLQTLGEHKQHADSQIQKGKHKLGKSKVLFRHKQKQLLTISICLLKLSVSLQTAVMPLKGMCSFIT